MKYLYFKIKFYRENNDCFAEALWYVSLIMIFLLSYIGGSQMSKLRMIDNGNNIIDHTIKKFSLSIFLGQNSSTLKREGEGVKENPIMTCLRAYRGIKMENATRLSGSPSDSKERQSFLKWG